jgi:glycosyltransferase involved in cell wall biosynthesis
MISIIIPAHNEAKVIGETLKELLVGAVQGEIEVIVVCNGCSDNTAEIVSSFGESFKCIETSVASKSNALNLGDAVAIGFPRFYLDADVVLSYGAVLKVAQVLRSGQFLAASPKMKMDFRHAPWTVRSYYQVWQQMPYVQEGMIGTGVFALSEKGRAQFITFPQIIADDGYIRSLFTTNERTVVDSCYSMVRSPTNLKGLLKIKTRSRVGGYELRKKFPELLQNEDKEYGTAFIRLIRRVDLWPMIPLYLYVNLYGRLRAKRYIYRNGFAGWERDDSSRSNASTII